MGSIQTRLGPQFAFWARQAEGIRQDERKTTGKSSKDITERRKCEREREGPEAMERKAVNVDEPGERIKDIYLADEGETSGETCHGDSEEEKECLQTQTHPEDYTRSCNNNKVYLNCKIKLSTI